MGERLPNAVVAVVALATVAGLLAVVAGVGGSVAGVGAVAGAGAMVAGLVAGAGTAVLRRESPAARGLGGLLQVCAGSLFLGAVGVAWGTLASTGALRWTLVAVCATALAAIAATSPRGVDDAAVASPAVASTAGATGALLGGGALLATVAEESVVGPLHGFVAFLRGTVGWLVEVLAWYGQSAGSTPGQELEWALASGCFLVAVTCHSLATAGSRLDPARLAARPRRPEIRERVDAVAERSDRVARVAGVLFGVSLLVATVPVPVPYDSAPALTAAATALVGATPLRAPLVLVAGLTWSVLLATWLVLVLSGARDWRVLPWVPALLGGAAAWLALGLLLVVLRDPVLEPTVAERGLQDVAVPLVGMELSEFLGRLDTRVGLSAFGILIALGGVATTLLFGTLWASSRLGYLVGPSSSGSVAGASLVLGGLAAGALGATPVAVVVPVAAGLVAWDAARFGDTVSAETGSSDGVRGPVLAHVAATVAVAVAACSIALATAYVPAGAVTPAQRVPVLLALAAGLLLLLWILQRAASDGSTTAELSVPGPAGTLRAHPLGWAVLVAVLATVGADRLVGLQLDEGVVVFGLLTVLLWWILGARHAGPDVDATAEPRE